MYIFLEENASNQCDEISSVNFKNGDNADNKFSETESVIIIYPLIFYFHGYL